MKVKEEDYVPSQSCYEYNSDDPDDGESLEGDNSVRYKDTGGEEEGLSGDKVDDKKSEEAAGSSEIHWQIRRTNTMTRVTFLCLFLKVMDQNQNH